jgi:DNA-binding protein H-NS
MFHKWSGNKMSNVDVSKLTYAQLLELSRQLEEQIGHKRDEELKVLADGYVKKIEAAGFSVAEAIEALHPYAPPAPAKPRNGSAGTTAPVMYQDAANPANTWSGRGRAAKWLADYEAQGRSRDDFKVKAG